MAELFARLQSALSSRYTLERELGRGGMATVYLARDLRHKRPVALKVLHPELAFALGADRFLREIEVAANLTHPHILPLHDSGEVENLLYYVMPYIEGESLRDRLRRETQLSVEDSIQIAREVADALAYAHGQGVVHRDIKPENILLYSRHALVADFGIARAVWQADDGRLTQTGLAVGTATYMSPEQASGAREVDGRSDVYSLGCVLYEMLAGEPPYTGPTAQAVIAKRFSDPVPSVRRLREAVPPAVERTINRALATVPADRLGTAAEFAAALKPGPGGTAATTEAVPVGPRAGVTRSIRRPAVVALAALLLLVALVVGIGELRRGQGAGDQPAAKVVAVLPFEHLGDSADAYFTDGVANDVRAKLAEVQGLAVIARASSMQYRAATKTPQEIGRELGADYLLTATVQWERVPQGASRVRVTSELVDARPGHPPRAQWSRQFDATMAEVFQVQTDIAEQVAQALDVALGAGTRRDLARRPTGSLPAYDAFLRGEAASQRMAAFAPASLQQAIAAYEQAVALDSTFAEAWARIAEAQATLYYNAEPTPARAEAARHAAERALALAPNRPEAHQAMALYYHNVVFDTRRAFTEDSIALTLAPGNAEVLLDLGWDALGLGRPAAARGHFERAARLDPRSHATADGLGFLLLSTRAHREAERAYDRALELEPENLPSRQFRAMVALAQGDLLGARAVLRAAPKEVDPTSLVAYIANYADLIWILEPAQQALVLRLTPSAFDNNRAIWSWVRAQAFALRRDSARARAYADTARAVLQSQLEAAPDNAELHIRIGLAAAYQGDTAAAVREGLRGVELLPMSRNAVDGAYLRHQLVRIYILVGEYDKALDHLEPLLRTPYFLSPDFLRIDPNFDPLRGNPRFERLVSGESQPTPGR